MYQHKTFFPLIFSFNYFSETHLFLFLRLLLKLSVFSSLMHKTNVAQKTFELQIRRCDLETQVYWDVKGSVGAEPSTFTCVKLQGPTNPFCPAGPWNNFWSPAPKNNVFNGTDVINGVKCNRFDFAMGMGAESFWATPTAPCRAEHASQRQDFLTWDATTPPESAFDGPEWLKDLTQCTDGSNSLSPFL